MVEELGGRDDVFSYFTKWGAKEPQNPQNHRVVTTFFQNVLELLSSHFEVLVNSESSTIFNCI